MRSGRRRSDGVGDGSKQGASGRLGGVDRRVGSLRSRQRGQWDPALNGGEEIRWRRDSPAVESRLDSGGAGVMVDDGSLEKLPDARA